MDGVFRFKSEQALGDFFKKISKICFCKFFLQVLKPSHILQARCGIVRVSVIASLSARGKDLTCMRNLRRIAAAMQHAAFATAKSENCAHHLQAPTDSKNLTCKAPVKGEA